MDRLAGNIVSSIRQRTHHQLYGDHLQDRYLENKLGDTDRMYFRNLKGHFGCVNALCFSNLSQEYLASGGDDKRILIWRMALATDCLKEPSPSILKTTHHSNIFTLSFSCDDSYIYSSGNDGLVLTYDARRGDSVQTYQYLGPVYCVDPHPSSPRVVAAATDDGSVYLIDTRAPTMSQEMVVADSVHSFHSVSFNPSDPHLLASGNEFNGAMLHDLRKWKEVLTYKASSLLLPWLKCDVMSVNFNSTGSRLCVLQKSEPPKIFKTLSSEPEFSCADDKETFRNSVTMKTACFAGDRDQYVVTGSDDFRVYWWKLPQEAEESLIPYLVIPGHRSIVNQTRYSKVHRTLVSSGVEKFIKVWTHFPMYFDQDPSISRDPPVRNHYSYDDLVLMSLAYDEASDTSLDSESMEESGRALAFFDQLIQEENGYEESSSDESIAYPLNYFIRGMHSPIDDNDDEDRFGPVIFHPHHYDSIDSEVSGSSFESFTESACNPLRCTCPSTVTVQVVPEMSPDSNLHNTLSSGVSDSECNRSVSRITETDSSKTNERNFLSANESPHSLNSSSIHSRTTWPSAYNATSSSINCSPCDSTAPLRCICPTHIRVYSDSPEYSQDLRALRAYFTKKSTPDPTDSTTSSSVPSSNANISVPTAANNTSAASVAIAASITLNDLSAQSFNSDSSRTVPEGEVPESSTDRNPGFESDGSPEDDQCSL